MSDATSVPERQITFQGREMFVKLPSEEQLLVWGRVIKQLQSPDVDGWNGERVLKALERVRRIIDSVLVHSSDREWLDDEMLDGNVKLPECADILLKTVEAFGDTKKQAASKAAPAKKAARRAPAKFSIPTT